MKAFFNSLNTFEKGKWLWFPSKNIQPEFFYENCKILTELFDGTDVCLKEMKYADKYLKENSFFVFVDNNYKPQIVGNIDKYALGNFRGVDYGYEQTINSNYIDVANDFLDKSKNILLDVDVWKMQTNWHARLQKYYKLFQSKQYNLINVDELIKDLAYNGYSLHYKHGVVTDQVYYPAIKRELFKEPMLKPLIAKHLNCRTDELYIGKYYGNGKDKKYIIGHLLSPYLHKECKITKVFGYLQIQNYKGEFNNLDNIETTISFQINGWSGCNLLFNKYFESGKEICISEDFNAEFTI